MEEYLTFMDWKSQNWDVESSQINLQIQLNLHQNSGCLNEIDPLILKSMWKFKDSD